MFILYYFYFSPLFQFIISIAFLFHFYCYTSVSTLILYLTTLISHIFCISTQIPDQYFKEIVTLVQKRTIPRLLLHNLWYKITVYTIWDVISVITKKYLRVPKVYNLWRISNNYGVDEMLLKVYVKKKHNLPEIINFFVICTNLKKFTWLTLSKANFGG